MKKDQSRFSFGANWQSFVDKALTPERIREATDSLHAFFGVNDLEGQTFLDIGCGSGLFSLAARKLGAKVHSFDLDPLSVACATELKTRYFPGKGEWTIEKGDVLDVDYMNTLGQFDLVYAWGILHHTGAMWQALKNVIPTVAEGGKLYLSIYNDQGRKSRYWTAIKKFYSQSSRLTRFMMTMIFLGYFGIPKVFFRMKKERGMSFWHDVVDWIGGYPFEVAKPEDIFDFYRDKGFALMKLKTRSGLGCNEFLFLRSSKKGQGRIAESRSEDK